MSDSRKFILTSLAAFCTLLAGSIAGQPSLVQAHQAQPSPVTADYATSVVMLGTGTPKADPERSGPAVAVVVGDRAYLFDAGPGIVRRAQAAVDRGNKALAIPKLDTLFITHLHSDHTLGLPDFIFSPWVLGRNHNPRIYGPTGTANMVSHIIAAWSEDIAMRTGGLEEGSSEGYLPEVKEIKPGVVLEEGGVQIEALLVPHGSWEAAYSYRITTPDKVVVISGDTGFSPRLAEFAKGADILVHEVFSEKSIEKSRHSAEYHRSFHTSPKELAEVARRAKPGLLVLYHQLFWGVSDADLIQQVRDGGYDGAIVSARDLDVYS